MKVTEAKAECPGEQRSGKRSAIGRVVWTLGIFAVSVLLLLALIGDARTFDQISGFVRQISSWLMMARLMVILAMWWHWDRLVEWMFRGGKQAGVAPLKAKRHSIASFLVLFELVVVQNVIGHFIRFVG